MRSYTCIVYYKVVVDLKEEVATHIGENRKRKIKNKSNKNKTIK